MFIAAPAARSNDLAFVFYFNNSTEVFTTKVTVTFKTFLDTTCFLADIANCNGSVEIDALACLIKFVYHTASLL